MFSQWAGRFAILFTTGLAIVALWLAFGTYRSFSGGRIAVLTIGSLGGVGAGSILLLVLYHCFTVRLPRLLRRIMVWVTFKTVNRFLAEIEPHVIPIGITPIDDDVGVGLSLGLRDGLATGDRFVVLNASSQEKWGVIQVYEIHQDSCVCSVFDRINLEFWDSLEARMRHEAAPPQGVTIRREIPDEYLLDWLTRLLKTPRG